MPWKEPTPQTHQAYPIEMLPPQGDGGGRRLSRQVSILVTPLITAPGGVCGLRPPTAPSAGFFYSQHGRRLTRTICLHYAGLFGEVSDGRLSWLKEDLIYWQTCFEGFLKFALLQIRVRRMAALGCPHIMKVPGSESNPLGGLGTSQAFELCTVAHSVLFHHPVIFLLSTYYECFCPRLRGHNDDNLEGEAEEEQ